MSDWHPRPAAQIGLRLIGIILIASLEPQGQWLRTLIQQNDDRTPVQLLLAASCFINASLGVILLMLGPDLWKPIAVARRWHGAEAREDRGDLEKSPRTADDACSSPPGRPGSQRRRTLERNDNAVPTL